ncbi:MAG: radical SAM protein, partial [Planctomycetaceae bacterium]
MSFLRWLRFQYCLATKSLSYSRDVIDSIYRIYLNHNKVIHYRDGYPVYSLTTPALFSKPMANFLARTFYRTLQNRNLPNLLSFAVNDECNAACQHCSFYDGVDQPGRATLSLTQAKKLIADAQELGVSVINFVGGEPLLRKDLAQIVASIDKSRSTSLLFTNGWLLAERARELKSAGLDSVYVSIDFSEAGPHDHFRQTPGMFDRALAGIREAKKLGFSTGFSVTMTPESWEAGELNKIIHLAKQVGVHEVFVFDALPTGRYQNRTDCIDNSAWVDDMIRSVEPFHRDASYPGVA